MSAGAARFDDETLRVLADRQEVDILTRRPDGTQRRTIIWVVVDRGDVFVRSYKGDRGHWFQAVMDAPDDVALSFDGREVPVRAEPATDDDSVARCSAGFQRKYARSASTPFMLEPKTLGTTLRLVPR